ncbi:FadR/GntR family transcriptional regulator [Ochrobactrum vermis]|uniref:FadR/GntR family transcriptional regulator n=1 Tax=Ochrobactrum vermis TaxID=1827297 RepID=A0ABU8PI64_9HYPH|nr:FadR/GntR family transcriptional regulator [Ochrobactrum vermis]PQZ25533.1 GntR family transcriptional regulator [Ochrobactrum vermis]
MSRTSAVQEIVQTLREEIPQEYKPGDLLQNERLIAERFGVSRNTVREALIHLEAHGIIEKTQRGPRVCAPDVSAVFHIMDQYFDRSPKTCGDLLEFRRMIDIGALPMVIERITESDIAVLGKHVDKVERALTANQAAQADYAFHNEIIRISGNSVLEKLYTVLSHTLIFYMEIGKTNPTNSTKTIDDHRAIIAALEERSLAKAIAAFTEHYDYSARSVAAAFEKNGQAEEV